MSPHLHPIKASAVASHGLLNTIGCPPDVDLGCNTNKSIGYSHESRDTISSSNTPSSLIRDRSANSSIVGLGRRLSMSNCWTVCKVMVLMASPRSMRVFGIRVPRIEIVTIGFSGSPYFSIGWSNNALVDCPM